MSGCDNFDFEAPQDEFQFMEGLRGADGTTFYPHVSADGVLSWTNNGDLPNPQPVDISGPPGASVELRGPVASVADLPVTASSSELWLVGTASPYDGWFYNGVRWENAGQIAVGPPGPAGEDGVSPVIAVTDIPGGHRVTITDASGTSSIDIMDGTEGAPGEDGVSPVIEITGIPGGHRVTITDASGIRSIDIMDGTDGAPGAPGATPDLQIGTVATGEPGSAAEATITGTPTAPRLNLTLPRGQQGPSVPLSDATPLMDGTASSGTGTSAARADHVHPADTSKQDKITANGILKGNGSGGVSAAVPGTDYLTPATNYSPIKSITATSYAIDATDVGKTLAIESNSPTVTLSQKVSDAMPTGSEIAMLVLLYADTASITINLPSGYGRAAGAGRSFSVARLNGGYDMYAIKKLWSRGWIVTGPDVEVVS